MAGHHHHHHGHTWDPHAVVWKPMPSLQVRSGDAAKGSPWITHRFLIDSGSWKTIVPHSLGKKMGFKKSPNDHPSQYITESNAPGATYVERSMQLKPGTLPAVRVPVAWVDKNAGDVRPAIGRAGVFKMYDITLSESSDSINFVPRGSTPGKAAYAAELAKSSSGRKINGQ
eukprot:TRINITY_DN16195_c0_g1_i1.p1 TRINITY_DN16195_c0_g1~~TRINITY_DN16195_c0_g1_i1.p1  ORF type:complete len:197 (+),score=35.68 TRINITY_DN16195_c0_g1_i1:79-591(+)